MRETFSYNLQNPLQLKVPSGWTYDDTPESEEDFANYEKMFLELCPPELKAWFGH